MTTLNENTGVDLIYKSRKGIIEMLEYRGYDVSDYSSFTKQEITIYSIFYSSFQYFCLI